MFPTLSGSLDKIAGMLNWLSMIFNWATTKVVYYTIRQNLGYKLIHALLHWILVFSLPHWTLPEDTDDPGN